MAALYIVTASLAAALCGAYARTFLASLGLITGIEAGTLLVGGVASAFLLSQCVWVGLLRAMHPTRSTEFYVSESLSHLAALILLPYLMHLEVEWPHPMLRRAEPLVYLGGFAGLHVFFKMAAFYASLGGVRVRAWSPVVWLAVGGVFGVLAIGGLQGWIQRAAEERPVVSERSQPARAGQAVVRARRLPEGSIFSFPIEGGDDTLLTLRWTPETSEAEIDNDDRIYVTVQVEGGEQKVYADSLRVSEDGWSTLRLPETLLSAESRTCTVRWTSRPQPNWQRMLGINPVIFTPPQLEDGGQSAPKVMWMAEPAVHALRGPETGMNFIVLMIDGLSMRHVSSNGYRRETTPNLDRFIRTGTVFHGAESAESESDLAALSLFSGRKSPTSDVLPKLPMDLRAKQRYATAAYTESQSRSGRGVSAREEWSEAFEIRDASVSLGQDAGAAATLGNVRRWAEAHENVPFLVYARVSELVEPEERPAYDLSFLPEGRYPRQIDFYDAALAHVDAQLGALLKALRDRRLHLNTCIVVTAPYSHGFSTEGRRLRGDRGESIPLIVAIPGQLSSSRKDVVSLADVGVTLSALANVTLDRPDGRNLLLPRGD